MVRAWLRSRAWNRRLPSMTRHDRQFIARVAVLLFLLAGFAWQFYEGWYRGDGPSLGSSSAGSLASLPLLLIPPGLFVAGLILELSAAPRRGSWALLAVLCRRGERLLPRHGHDRRDDQPQPHVLHPARRARPHLHPARVLLRQDGVEPEAAPRYG